MRCVPSKLFLGLTPRHWLRGFAFTGRKKAKPIRPRARAVSVDCSPEWIQAISQVKLIPRTTMKQR